MIRAIIVSACLFLPGLTPLYAGDEKAVDSALLTPLAPVKESNPAPGVPSPLPVRDESAQLTTNSPAPAHAQAPAANGAGAAREAAEQAALEQAAQAVRSGEGAQKPAETITKQVAAPETAGKEAPAEAVGDKRAPASGEKIAEGGPQGIPAPGGESEDAGGEEPPIAEAAEEGAGPGLISVAAAEPLEQAEGVPYSAAVEREEIERVDTEAGEGMPILDKFAPAKEEKPGGKEGGRKLPITADADSVEYDREQNVITGTGNAVVKYQDAKLTADKITVYMDTGDAYAEGNVSLFQQGQFLTGKNLRYNFQTGQGNIEECHAYSQPWYGYGKVVRRISEDEYQVDNGYVTTCDYPKPHTSIRAKKIYLYPGDSVVAHNAVLYLYETPVFWTPYAKYSLTDDESPYNLVPGFSSDWGFFLLSAVDVYKTKNIRITPHLDLRTKHGVGEGVTLDYLLPSAAADGEAVFYYTHDRDPDYTLNSKTDKKDRYRVTWVHQEDFSEDTRMSIQFNMQSDEDFIDDFFRSEYEDTIQRENYLDITKAAEKYQLSLLAEPRFNDFYTVVQRLPEFSAEAVNQRIDDTPFFYQGRSAITNFDYVFSDDPLTADQADAGIPQPPIPDPIRSLRIDTVHQFSYPKKYFKFLNFEPYVGFRETFYSKAPKDASNFQGSAVLVDTNGNGVLAQNLSADKPVTEENSVWRGLFFLGAQTDTKMWRTWDYYNNALKINRLRHLVQPGLGYQLFTKPTRVYPEEVYAFDDVDFFNELSMFTLSLRNALQTKRGEGEDVDLFDIKMYLDMVTNVGRYRGWQHRAFADDHYSSAEVVDGFNKLFNDLFIDAEFRPIDWQKLDMQAYFRLDPARLDEFNTDYYVYRDDIVSLSLGQRYLVNESNLWTTEFNLQLNDDWAARTYLRFETADGTFQEGEWSLFRDLHEWEAAFTVRYRGGNNSSVGFFVVLYLDAYPDVPLDIGF